MLLRKRLADIGWTRGRPRSLIVWVSGRRQRRRSGGCCLAGGSSCLSPARHRSGAYRSFTAPRANECWQIDDTTWWLADETEVKIVDVIDDCSRVLVRRRAVSSCTGEAAVARCCTHRPMGSAGAVPVGQHDRLPPSPRPHPSRHSASAAGHSRPHHPQTCGKVCEHVRGAAPGRSDPGQSVTVVSFVRFVDRPRCCATARTGQTDLT